MAGMPISDAGPKPRYAVAPTLASVVAKRTQPATTASNSIYQVRAVVDPANANDAMQQLKGCLDDCIVLGRNDSETVWLSADCSVVYLVCIATATNTATYSVTAAETEANFLAAMLRLDFAAVDEVRRVDIKTADLLAAAGTVDTRYIELIVEGYSNAS